MTALSVKNCIAIGDAEQDQRPFQAVERLIINLLILPLSQINIRQLRDTFRTRRKNIQAFFTHVLYADEITLP